MCETGSKPSNTGVVGYVLDARIPTELEAVIGSASLAGLRQRLGVELLPGVIISRDPNEAIRSSDSELSGASFPYIEVPSGDRKEIKTALSGVSIPRREGDEPSGILRVAGGSLPLHEGKQHRLLGIFGRGK